jgi:hypothetical protein
MKDTNFLSNPFGLSRFSVLVCIAVASLLTCNQTTIAQELDRSSAIATIQEQADAMRQELIQSYRGSAQFGALIANNSKIKGSSRRLAEKLNRPNVNWENINWENEANELDGLIYQLESLIEEANYHFVGDTPIQTSTYLGNMLAAVESIKNPNNTMIGQTGLNENDVANFFESEFDPIQSDVEDPKFSSDSDLIPASQSTVVDDPFSIDVPAISENEPVANLAQQPEFDLPLIDTPPPFEQPLIEQPLIMDGQTGNSANMSVLEPPSYEVPKFEDEVQPPTLEMPHIVAPSPELMQPQRPQPQVQRPQVALRPELIPSKQVPQLIAPRPTISSLSPRPTRTAQLKIDLLMVRPNYVPYRGYGGYVPYGGYRGYGAPRIPVGYLPYGGLNVRGGYGGYGGYRGGRNCPYGR